MQEQQRLLTKVLKDSKREAERRNLFGRNLSLERDNLFYSKVDGQMKRKNKRQLV